jgi:hypothetical protein
MMHSEMTLETCFVPLMLRIVVGSRRLDVDPAEVDFQVRSLRPGISQISCPVFFCPSFHDSPYFEKSGICWHFVNAHPRHPPSPSDA